MIIDLNVDLDDPDDDWDEPGAQLAAMVQVRSEIAAGDLRLLYLGWLLSVQWSEVDDDDVEPPVPAGLGQLSGALQAVADFLSIDTDLLAEAATASPATRDRNDHTGLTEWIDTLPGPEKNTLLARVVAGEGSYVQGLLLHRFRASRPADEAKPGRRTAGQLLDAAEDRREARLAAEAERRGQKDAQRKAAAAAAYARRLDDMAARESAVWEQAELLIEAKTPRSYEEAAELLVDLRALAERRNESEAFAERVRRLREQHKRRPALLQRFDKAGLP